MAHHKGPKEVSEKEIIRWWNGLDWLSREEIARDLPWSRLTIKQRSEVRKSYAKWR